MCAAVVLILLLFTGFEGGLLFSKGLIGSSRCIVSKGPSRYPVVVDYNYDRGALSNDPMLVQYIFLCISTLCLSNCQREIIPLCRCQMIERLRLTTLRVETFKLKGGTELIW